MHYPSNVSITTALWQKGKILPLIGLIMLPYTGTANAQSSPEGSDYLSALRECKNLPEDGARLICYDQAVASVLAKSDAGEIKVVDKEDIAETRRGLFGFSLPKLGIFGSGDDDAEQLDLMQSTITSVQRARSDEWLLTITEGSIWRVSNAPRRFKPKVGDAVEFKRASMGSFFVRVNGGLGVKGRRIE